MADPQHRPAADELTAIHHPARRRIFEHLHLEGPSTVGGLAASLGLQVGSVSHHLRTLEAAGFVEAAPDLARDRRESWWRSLSRRVSWSLSDFAGSPTDLLLATAAERANLQHHNDKVLAWFTDREEAEPAWTDAAFATEQWATATPEELHDLSARVTELLASWAEQCRAAAATEPPEAAARRTPVFVFAHGNPSRP